MEIYVKPTSSAIKCYTYSSKSRVLKIQFSLSSYTYKNVSNETFRAFDRADSTGKAFNILIKNQYNWRK